MLTRVQLVAMAVLVTVGAGCGGGGGGGGSGAPAEALFSGPLMLTGTQMRVYRTRNVQLADFNNDDRLDLYYEADIDSNDDGHLLVGLRSDTEIFEEPQPVTPGEESSLADFDADGNLDILAIMPVDQKRGFAFGDWALRFGNGDATFSEIVPLNLPDLPDEHLYVTSADFTGDGFEDLMSLGYLTITPFINQGDATFEPATQVEIPLNFGFPAGGDLNNDTFDDIVYFEGSQVSAALSNGEGTFQPLGPVVENSPVSIETILPDINNDGNLDFIGLAAGEGFSVFLGAGDGTFGPAVLTPFDLSDGGAEIHTIADFNDDGVPDLVFSTVLFGRGFQISRLYIALGVGDGSFGPQATLVDEGQFGNTVTLDADEDGNTDMLVSVFTGTIFLRAYFGNGDGTFRVEEPTRLTVGTPGNLVFASTLTRQFPSSAAESTASFDVNGDGNADLMTSNSDSNDLSLLLGNGDGTFQPDARIPLTSAEIELTADLDVDGDLDFLGTASLFGYVVIMRNYGGTDIRELPPLPFSSASISRLGVHDMDGDDLLDLVLWFFNNTIGVAYNLRDMQFSPMVVAGVDVLYNQGRVGDVNGDGYEDFVSYRGAADEGFVVIPGAPGRTFGAPIAIALPGDGVGNRTFNILDDLTGDGRADAVVQTEGAGNPRLRVYNGQPDGTLVLDQEFILPQYFPSWPTAADVDGDGDQDMYTWMFSGETLFEEPLGVAEWHTFINTGTALEYGGSVRAGFAVTVGESFDVVMADVSGEGILDAIGLSTTGALSVALGLGDGTFDRPYYFNTELGSNLQIGDLDNDGDNEIVAESDEEGELIVMENRTVRD